MHVTGAEKPVMNRSIHHAKHSVYSDSLPKFRPRIVHIFCIFVPYRMICDNGIQEVRGSIPLISTTNSPHPSGCGLLLYVHTAWYRLRCRVIKTALMPGACKTPRAFTPAGRYQRSRAASRGGRECPASPLPHPITRQCLSARLRTSQPSAVTRTRSSTRTPISPGR